MSLVESSTAHLPFVEAMAALPSESDPEWSALGAELLVLRAVDTWSHPAWSTDDELAEQVAAVNRFVAAAGSLDEPTRVALRDVLRAIGGPRSRHVPLETALLRYGRALERRGRWEFARDVYDTLIDLRRHVTRSDPATDIEAWMRLAECHRQQAAWPASSAAFDRATQLAEAAGEPAVALRARCYAAAVTAERGNLPGAEAALARLEDGALRAGHAARAIVQHARAHVAFLRHDFELAARLAFEALGALDDPCERDRALADLAAAFAELGVRSAARDAHLVLSATTQDPTVRWTALINLMELAASDGMRDAFDNYLRMLAAESLPPRLAGYYHLYAGTGARVFGDTARAHAEYQRAIDVATRAGVAQLVFDAERAGRELDERTPVAAGLPRPAPTPETAAIADALARMRAEVHRDA